MASNQGIQITGLKEFRAGLKAMDADTPQMIKSVFNESAELVAAGARLRWPVRTGAGRASVRVASTTTMAQIREGGGGVPYAGFIDYGGTVGRRRHTAEFRAAKRGGKGRIRAPRPYIPTGRIMYPAYLAVEAQVRKTMAAGLQRLGASKGIGVSVNGGPE